MIFNYLQVLIVSSVVASSLCANLPILYWHSAGETCCQTEYDTYCSLIRRELGDDVYIKAVQIGNSLRSDRVRSITMHPFDQIKIVCDMIKSDEKFQHGYNGIGFSQGGLFIRALAQTCPYPPMRNLISLGGPQNGVNQFPRCGIVYGTRCAFIHLYITVWAYQGISQRHFTPATYWHDLIDARYRAGNTFLPVINNENEINYDYVRNLKSLKKLVLVKYEEDVGVVPNESTWFGYYNYASQTVPLEDLPLYKQDRLGLKAMKENDQLVFLTSPLGHLKLDEPWFIDNIIPYLKVNATET